MMDDKLTISLSVRGKCCLPDQPLPLQGKSNRREVSERHQSEGKLERGISEPVTKSVIKRAQDGEANALTALYENYKPVVYRYLYYRLGERHLAEDLTTEVFIRVIKNLDRYHPHHSHFDAWLFKIARNLAIDHIRKSKLRQHVRLDENLIAPSGGPESITERNQSQQQLRQALLCLTDDQCEVIVLRFLADLPITQVARLLNKSEGAVKALQARALEALQRKPVLKEIYD